jgi:hypothetical protein
MELAKASKTLEEIAKTMNRTPDRIRKVAMRLGVSVKSKISADARRVAFFLPDRWPRHAAKAWETQEPQRVLGP